MKKQIGYMVLEKYQLDKNPVSQVCNLSADTECFETFAEAHALSEKWKGLPGPSEHRIVKFVILISEVE